MRGAEDKLRRTPVGTCPAQHVQPGVDRCKSCLNLSLNPTQMYEYSLASFLTVFNATLATSKRDPVLEGWVLDAPTREHEAHKGLATLCLHVSRSFCHGRDPNPSALW